MWYCHRLMPKRVHAGGEPAQRLLLREGSRAAAPLHGTHRVVCYGCAVRDLIFQPGFKRACVGVLRVATRPQLAIGSKTLFKRHGCAGAYRVAERGSPPNLDIQRARWPLCSVASSTSRPPTSTWSAARARTWVSSPEPTFPFPTVSS